MPEIKYFTVSQTREVKIVANDPVDAVRIAGRIFDNGMTSDGWPNPPIQKDGEEEGVLFGYARTREVEVTEIIAREDF